MALDIVVDIDTVAAALAGQAVDLIAAELEPAQHLVAARLDTGQDFDPTTGTVIVLEMCLPVGQLKVIVSSTLNNPFSCRASFGNMLERFSRIVSAFCINFPNSASNPRVRHIKLSNGYFRSSVNGLEGIKTFTKLSHFAFISLLNHLWWNTETHRATHTPDFRWFETLKTFPSPFAEGFSHFPRRSEKFVCREKQRTKRSGFLLSREQSIAIYFCCHSHFIPKPHRPLHQALGRLPLDANNHHRSSAFRFFPRYTLYNSTTPTHHATHFYNFPLSRWCWLSALSVAFLSSASHISPDKRKKQAARNVMMCTFN